jgi:uncharacterized protein YbcI
VLSEGIEERQATSVAICHAVVGTMKRALGRGPTGCRADLRNDHVVVFCRETLTDSERTLVEVGRSDHVKVARLHINDAIASELVDAVETITGREVTSFMADIDPAADCAVKVFTFAPTSTPTNGSDPAETM